MRQSASTRLLSSWADRLCRCQSYHAHPLQYALWEEKQKDFRRARSVFERALDVNYNAVNLWLKYAEMEMRHRFVNHARNVWDRAVTLMPRVDQLWWVHSSMWSEARWQPLTICQPLVAPGIWRSRAQLLLQDSSSMVIVSTTLLRYKYIHMEEMLGNVAGARQIFERWMKWEPDHNGWAAYIKVTNSTHGAC
jgi:crooked neck